MNLVDEYMDSLDEPKKTWLFTMVHFMREVFPELKESLNNKRPTYTGTGFFIAFGAQKNYFTFYTDDREMLPLINELVPSVAMGKGSAKIKYTSISALKSMMDLCIEIVDQHKAQQSPTITDIKALKKWTQIPPNIQNLILGNVLCSTCGITRIVNYGIQDDRFGIILNGFCEKCVGHVVRMVEN